jgi:hypothetical protein
MWNKKNDKCWLPFDGVVHGLMTWFIIGEVKGSIPNIIIYVHVQEVKVGRVG